jgi:hypothetical protein
MGLIHNQLEATRPRSIASGRNTTMRSNSFRRIRSRMLTHPQEASVAPERSSWPMSLKIHKFSKIPRKYLNMNKRNFLQ